MGDILKEAIADAKAVRETALENAKMALEEAFTPQLKSMLSAKLKEEDDTEEDMHGDDEAEEGSYSEEEEVPAEEGEHEDDAEVPAEEGEHEDEAEEGHDDVEEDEDEDEVEEDLDLEAVIAELEAELAEGDDDDEEVEESTETSDEPVSEGEGDDEDEPVEESTEETVEEEYEVDEAAITEEEDEEVEESISDNSELSVVQAELKEYKEAVGFLKTKLNELNILNAKLLFTNKLFKSFSLDNNQKLKVVETFDRAQTTREIKLVYSTLAEQFGDNSSITRKNITESIASSKSGSTKPSAESKKVISEETNVADRFRKLAGLQK